MGTIVGAKVEDLETASRSCTSVADRLSGVTTTINNTLENTAWKGPKATDFRTNWTDQGSRQVTEAATQIRQLADRLHREATQQTKASGRPGTTTTTTTATTLVPLLRRPTFGPPVPTNKAATSGSANATTNTNTTAPTTSTLPPKKASEPLKLPKKFATFSEDEFKDWWKHLTPAEREYAIKHYGAEILAGNKFMEANSFNDFWNKLDPKSRKYLIDHNTHDLLGRRDLPLAAREQATAKLVKNLHPHPYEKADRKAFRVGSASLTTWPGMTTNEPKIMNYNPMALIRNDASAVAQAGGPATCMGPDPESNRYLGLVVVGPDGKDYYLSNGNESPKNRDWTTVGTAQAPYSMPVNEQQLRNLKLAVIAAQISVPTMGNLDYYADNFRVYPDGPHLKSAPPGQVLQLDSYPTEPESEAAAKVKARVAAEYETALSKPTKRKKDIAPGPAVTNEKGQKTIETVGAGIDVALIGANGVHSWDSVSNMNKFYYNIEYQQDSQGHRRAVKTLYQIVDGEIHQLTVMN
jgi:hypothetical protein